MFDVKDKCLNNLEARVCVYKGRCERLIRELKKVQYELDYFKKYDTKRVNIETVIGEFSESRRQSKIIEEENGNL